MKNKKLKNDIITVAFILFIILLAGVGLLFGVAELRILFREIMHMFGK